MKMIRRTRKHAQQGTNVCEKELKRQGLVKKLSRIQCVCLFISSSFVLSLSDSLTVLFRAECGFKKERNQQRLQDTICTSEFITS